MRAAFLVSWALAAGAAAWAQPPDEALQSKLQRLAIAAEALESRLPAFACRESLVSQELRGGKVKKQVQASGSLRVLAGEDGTMEEQFEPAEVNGVPFQPGSFHPPLFVTGGFRHALGVFLLKDQACFDFRLTANRIDFNTRTPVTGSCEKKSGITGFALFDQQGTLSHVELNTELLAARKRNAVPVGALDLSEIELGQMKFLLSTHVIAEQPAGKSTYRWEASFTGCRLFRATVKIDDATPVPDDAPK